MADQRIVVVEDEPDIREVIEHSLKREGYHVNACADGVEALKIVRELGAELVLLDLMLPGIDGLEVCRRLKSDPITSKIPIVMLTAKGEESDVVIGLSVGADDYVTKPFSPRVLVARIRAVMRRGSERDAETGAVVKRGGLIMDRDAHRATYDENEINLTATEFRILWELASSPGRVFTRDLLISRALGETAAVSDRTIDVHIRAIRSKLGDGRELVRTRRGVGYSLSPEDS